jgi:hypothetical protein
MSVGAGGLEVERERSASERIMGYLPVVGAAAAAIVYVSAFPTCSRGCAVFVLCLGVCVRPFELQSYDVVILIFLALSQLGCSYMLSVVFQTARLFRNALSYSVSANKFVNLVPLCSGSSWPWLACL